MSDSLPRSYVVPPDFAGARLDRFAAAELPDLSRSRLQDLIREGHLTLNGAAVKPSAKLRLGDVIAYVAPPVVSVETQAQDIPLKILYEDAHLVVIDKPAGMVVHPAAGNWDGTVVNALLHHCGELSEIGGEHRPGIVHRLDKDTSGCLVVAKSDAVHRKLAAGFADREVTKIYLALAAGRPLKKGGLIESSIGRHPVDRKRMAVLTDGRGKLAKTEWRVLQEIAAPEAPGGIATLIECTLHTGRTHQIRVHLKQIGHPILGDELYGRRAGFQRQMLHAWRLGFVHPVTGQRLECRAELPEDFRLAGVRVTNDE